MNRRDVLTGTDALERKIIYSCPLILETLKLKTGKKPFLKIMKEATSYRLEAKKRNLRN